MHIKYYIKNVWLSLYITFLYAFLFIHQKGNIYLILSDSLFLLILISAILSPFSKYLIEYIAFRFIKKNFFETRKNLNNAPGAKAGLYMLYNLFYLALGIPFGLLGLFICIKKMN